MERIFFFFKKRGFGAALFDPDVGLAQWPFLRVKRGVFNTDSARLIIGPTAQKPNCVLAASSNFRQTGPGHPTPSPSRNRSLRPCPTQDFFFLIWTEFDEQPLYKIYMMIWRDVWGILELNSTFKNKIPFFISLNN